MANEFKKIISNIKNIRKLVLNEGVSQNSMADAINNHKVIYINYAGDETIQKGYRTIKPFVVGVHKKSGNSVVRAWQDAGNSDSYNNVKYHNYANKKRQDHEYHFDHKGRMKPGWRLFRLDKIVSMLPTGEQFNPQNIINSTHGVNYNPGDKDMSSIVAAIQPTPDKSTQVTGTDSTDKPDVTKTKVDKSSFDTQTPKFQRFFKAGQQNRGTNKEEIQHLYDLNQKYKKRPARKMLVVQNEKGDLVLKPIEQQNNIPSGAVVGNLQDLYQKFVVPSRKGKEDKSFWEKSKGNLGN